MKCYVDIPFKI